jgi:hypothetical protein
VKVWVSAVVLVGAAFLVAAPRIWPQGGGAQGRTASSRAAVMTVPAHEILVPTPTLEPSASPQPMTHRPSVLQQFACGDCHGVASGWLMPPDHAGAAEAECQDCHQPAPEPPAIALHDWMGHEDTSTGHCGLCHTEFAESAPPAPASPSLCVRCHGAETDDVLPASHAGRSDATSTCIVCHETRALARPAVPHRIEGWEQCNFCHGPQRLTELGGAHTSSASQKCLSCHDATRPPDLNRQMHTLSTEKGGCASCHAPDRLAPLPESHAGRSELLCLLCHEPAAEEAPVLPHDLEREQQGLCTSCHTDGRLGMLPYDHTTRTDAMCVACHAVQPGGVPVITHTLENRAACTDCHLPSSDRSGPAAGLAGYQ